MLKNNRPQIIFEGIGTHWVIDLYQIDAGVDVVETQKILLERVERFDKNYSRFRQDSLVWKMSKKMGWFDLPEDGQELLKFYEKIYKITDGRVTPMVGDLLSGMGYDQMYSFVLKKTDQVATWDEALELADGRLKLKKNVLLDFGAAGKGYLVDILAKILISQGVTSFCINGGGDIYVKNRMEKVGLENPFDKKQVIGVVNVNNQSICASATNRRAWDKYHHIVDPKTRQSTVGIVATWVMAQDAMTADMLATSLFLVPVEKLRQEFDFEYLVMDGQMAVNSSKAFQKGLFSATTE